MTERPRQVDADRLEEICCNSWVFVAWEDCRVVGMMVISINDHIASTDGWIEDVVVDEDYRRRGIAEQMMAYAMTVVGSEVDRFKLTSKLSREAARALYGKLGFEPVETQVFRRQVG